MRCPRCAQDSLYRSWNVLNDRCNECGYGFEEREGNCWFFLYSTTAALTGLLIVIILVWRPEYQLLARVILGVVSASVIALSLPIRKGIALALEFIAETRGSNLLLYDDSKIKDRQP